MFTGIITHKARVAHVTRGEQGGTFTFEFSEPLATELGDSLAINGVCLTVAEHTPTSVTMDVMPETIHRTNLEHLQLGQRVNVEPALSVTAKLDGHFVLGHVDTTVTVAQMQRVGESTVIRFNLPAEYYDYVVEKGSVAVNGVSLTVTTVTPGSFGVSLVDYTLQHTTLGDLEVGQTANLETDILGKYAVKLSKGDGEHV